MRVWLVIVNVLKAIEILPKLLYHTACPDTDNWGARDPFGPKETREVGTPHEITGSSFAEGSWLLEGRTVRVSEPLVPYNTTATLVQT